MIANISKSKYFLISALTPLLLGCDEEIDDIDKIDIPEGYMLSAGISTVFNNSSFAYDQDAPWVAENVANRKRFTHGDKLYDDALTQSSGLGPVYAGYSCGSCHRNAGRTKPALWTQISQDADGTPVYGSGEYGFSSMLVYVARKNGQFFQNYGRVLHDQSIYGIQAEGKLQCRWHYEDFEFPDGEKYQLARPEYTITDWYAKYGDTDDPIDPSELFCSVRIPPGEDAIELARVVDRGIRESGMVDVEQLCIVPGEEVWMCFVDIYALDYDGNLFDAANLAAVSALRTAVIPAGEYQEFVRKNGCGHCCASMALRLNGIDIDPHKEFTLCMELWGEPEKDRAFPQDNLQSVAGITKILNHFGVKAEYFGVPDLDVAEKHFDETLRSGIRSV